MRQLKLSAALAAVICGLLALAGSALANEFVVTPGAATRGGSGTEREQEFNFGPFQIQCSAARSKGEADSTALSVTTRFSQCSTVDHFGSQTLPLKTRFKGPLTLLYTGQGAVGLSSAPAISIAGLKCTISLGQQGSSSGGAGAGKVDFLGGASFTNVSVPTRRVHQFPAGFQHGLMIDNEVEEIPFQYSGSCAGFGGSGETGSYTGALWDEATDSNLEFVDTGEEWNKVKNNPEGWNKVKNNPEGE